MKKLFLSLAIGACASAAACKKVEYRDKPETLDELERLKRDLQIKDDLIREYREKIVEAEMGTGGSGAPEDKTVIARLEQELAAAQATAAEVGWIFVIEGDALVIKSRPTVARRGDGGETIDDATATAMGEQFIAMVKKSRGSIQKCYEQALKKSSGLQARTVNLTLSVSFAKSGAFNKVSFDYDLPQGFDTCLRGVASKWKLPAAGASRTFQTTVKLTPT